MQDILGDLTLRGLCGCQLFGIWWVRHPWFLWAEEATRIWEYLVPEKYGERVVASEKLTARLERRVLPLGGISYLVSKGWMAMELGGGESDPKNDLRG